MDGLLRTKHQFIAGEHNEGLEIEKAANSSHIAVFHIFNIIKKLIYYSIALFPFRNYLGTKTIQKSSKHPFSCQYHRFISSLRSYLNEKRLPLFIALIKYFEDQRPSLFFLRKIRLVNDPLLSPLQFFSTLHKTLNLHGRFYNSKYEKKKLSQIFLRCYPLKFIAQKQFLFINDKTLIKPIFDF